MDSNVRARPNHYEVLDLTPQASDAEIAAAFGRAIATPRGLGGIAEASIAYEALRDPERRQAYDRSIGLGPQPEPEPEPEAEPARSEPREWSPFLIRAAARPAGPPRHDPLPPPKAKPEPKPFIAAPPPIAERAEPVARPAPAPRPPVEVHFPQAEEFAVDWKRSTIVAGAAVLGVGLLGAWAGLAASSDIEAAPQPQAKPAVTMKLAPPEPLPVVAAAAAAPAQASAPPRTWRHARAAAPRPQASRADRVAEIKRGLEDYYASATAGDTATQPTAPVQAASLPLSNAVVARTIHRIGYKCGSVASTESSGGGVFRVTCTSGHSYQASPVRGRYHFRKLG